MNRTSTSPARLRSPLHRSATATADLSPPSRSSTAPTHPQLHHTHHLNLQNNAASKRLRLTGGLSAGFGSSPGQPSYYEYTRDKSMTQSATHLHPPYGNDLQLSRTLSSRNMASASGTSSNVISRRGSLVALGEAPEQGEEKKIIDAAELAREKDKAKGRDDELRTSLHTLAKLSSTTATRLDDTYYSILESVSSLHSTLLSLHSLSHLTATLHSHFQSQTTSLSQTISHSVRALSSHVPQHTHRIQTLDSRLHKGREKVRLLGDRLEDVREKIATWEKREREWQAKTTRRLRLLWAVMGAVALLMAILWGVHYFGPAGRDGGGGEGGPGAPLAVSENGDALVSGVGGGDVAGKANDSSSFLADVIEAVGGKKKINDGNGGGGRGMKDAAGVPKTAAVSSSPPNDDDDDNNDTPLRLFDEL